MEFRLWLVCLLLAMAAVVECFHFDHVSLACRPELGECDRFHPESELMDSEINQRLLRASRRYIGYKVLNGNSIPCKRRGHSYYNCRRMRRANPYKRGCSAITRCRRSTG